MGLGAWRSGIFPPGVKFVIVVLEFVLEFVVLDIFLFVSFFYPQPPPYF